MNKERPIRKIVPQCLYTVQLFQTLYRYRHNVDTLTLHGPAFGPLQWGTSLVELPADSDTPVVAATPVLAVGAGQSQIFVDLMFVTHLPAFIGDAS